MAGELVHVSQLYQTVTTVAVFMLFLMEIASYCFELYPHLEKERIQIIAQENDWIRNRGLDSEQKKAQENAASELNGQISTLEKQAQQQKPQRQEQKPQKQQQKNDEPPKQIEPQMQKLDSKPQQKIEQSREMTDKQKGLMHMYMLYQRFINEHTPVIISVLVVGLLGNSTYIFTLACYFCYLFCNILFDFIQIQEKIRAQYKKGVVVSRLVKLSSGLFVIAIFASYIINVQYRTPVSVA